MPVADGFSRSDHPHRRYNPLAGRHVLVSPHRAKRPWLGQENEPEPKRRPSHDPDCYLCPGNERIGGETNPDYEATYVFDNDFPALLAESPDIENQGDGLFAIEPVTGQSRVICFSPDHNLTIPDLAREAMVAVVQSWCEESAALGRKYPWVQVFENKGAMMGCSNPHPHGQVWATSFLPDEVQAEDVNQRRHFREEGRAMLLDIANQEAEFEERIVTRNDDWLAIVPFWASWPFETLVLPRFKVARLHDLASGQRGSLADIIQSLTRIYDSLFGVSFPYSMGWHGAPFTPDADTHAWQLHAHFYPPLLRSASVRKFMVGYEMMAEAQRDLTPEQAAGKLRDAAPKLR